MQINGVEKTNSLNGAERGSESTQFSFFHNAPSYDNTIGTILGEVRLVSDSIVVFDGIPCIRDRDGVCGFFDVVNNRFCTETGSTQSLPPDTKTIAAWYAS
jgi:hypothetical protein